jgi:hypothetical protein
MLMTKCRCTETGYEEQVPLQTERANNLTEQVPLQTERANNLTNSFNVAVVLLMMDTKPHFGTVLLGVTVPKYSIYLVKKQS